MNGDTSLLNIDDYNINVAFGLVTSELMGERINWDEQTLPVFMIAKEIKNIRLEKLEKECVYNNRRYI